MKKKKPIDLLQEKSDREFLEELESGTLLNEEEFKKLNEIEQTKTNQFRKSKISREKENRFSDTK